jgi:SAM-dependent methyltransferase
MLLSSKDLMTNDMRLNCLAALSGGLEGKRLLEIGCGGGELLVGALHRGASVFGNDISRESCVFVRERLRIPVFEGPLAAMEFEREFGRMDIVVMSDLIEHPVDPLVVFESALDVLKPDGLLLILTPNGGNARSDGVSVAGQWVGFRVDLEHLQYLSPRTISILADRYQCGIEHLESVGYPSLQGIDRLPTSTAVANRSLRTRVRTELKKLAWVRNLVRKWQTFNAVNSVDPRSGTYHLFAVLRKRKDREHYSNAAAVEPNSRRVTEDNK